MLIKRGGVKSSTNDYSTVGVHITVGLKEEQKLGLRCRFIELTVVRIADSMSVGRLPQASQLGYRFNPLPIALLLSVYLSELKKKRTKNRFIFASLHILQRQENLTSCVSLYFHAEMENSSFPLLARLLEKTCHSEFFPHFHFINLFITKKNA